MLHRLFTSISVDRVRVDALPASCPERRSESRRVAGPRIWARASLGLFAALLTTLCFAGTALAGSKFVPASSFGSAGSGNGEFSSPAGVAVEQSSGDVYVADSGNGRVQKFEAGGGYLSQFSGAETPAGSFSSPTAVAVDNSSSPFDASAGDVYVIDSGHNVVDKFSSAGVYAGQLTATPHGEFSELQGVAVDSNGNVWVSQASGEVAEFASDGANSFVSAWSTNQGAGQGLAVNPAGSQLYVVLGWGGLMRYSGSGAELGLLDCCSTHAIAVDPQTGDVFADDVSQIAEYDASGSQVETFGSGTLQSGAGVAFDDSDGHLYVADAAANHVQVFGTIKTPDAVTEAPSAITNESATLQATVNPNGLPTTCSFRWASKLSEGETGGVEWREGIVPCEPESVVEGESPVTVHAQLTGLQPNRPYHYHVIVTNANGTATGQDQSFIVHGPPLVESATAYSVGSSDATLLTDINPEGQHAVYHFEYGATSAYGTSLPAPDGDLGSERAGVRAIQHLTALQPGSTYHFRVVATGENGTAASEDRTFTTLAATSAEADTCPNAARRAEQHSAYLPECRAWEVVSPPNKGGANVMAGEFADRSASDGSAVQYASLGAFGDAHGTSLRVDYVARRDAAGWVTHAISPETTPVPFPANFNQTRPMGDFSADLSTGLMYSSTPLTHAPNVEHVGNLYLRRDLLSAGLGEPLLLSNAAEPVEGISPVEHIRPQVNLVGASRDFQHVVFESVNKLMPEALQFSAFGEPITGNLYESEDGTVRLASVLPTGEISGEAHGYMVSRDGSRIVFRGSAEQGNLYIRENHTSTTQLNLPENGETEPEPVAYRAATPDGSSIFFEVLNSQGQGKPLTSAPLPLLYRYDVNAPAGHHLTPLVYDEEPGGGANLAGVLGVSEDGSYVYFTVNRLTKMIKGQPELPRPLYEEPSNYAETIYVWHNGSLHFVGELAAYTGENGENRARVTPTGELVYGTNTPQTSYDVTCTHNCGARTGTAKEEVGCTGIRCFEVYVYDPAVGHTVCASCDPNGVAPLGNAFLDEPAYASVVGTQYRDRHIVNNFTADGSKVFFDSPDPLVPQDVNGTWDVYEYDLASHRLSLLSSGRPGTGSFFAEATPNGSDVFFVTEQQLVGQDTDSESDLYDARVGGGLAAQNQLEPAQCAGEACQGVLNGQPVFGTPASLAAAGAGNLAPPPPPRPAKHRPAKHHPVKHRKHCAKRGHGRKKARCSTRPAARRAKR